MSILKGELGPENQRGWLENFKRRTSRWVLLFKSLRQSFSERGEIRADMIIFLLQDAPISAWSKVNNLYNHAEIFQISRQHNLRPRKQKSAFSRFDYYKNSLRIALFEGGLPELFLEYKDLQKFSDDVQTESLNSALVNLGRAYLDILLETPEKLLYELVVLPGVSEEIDFHIFALPQLRERKIPLELPFIDKLMADPKAINIRSLYFTWMEFLTNTITPIEAILGTFLEPNVAREVVTIIHQKIGNENEFNADFLDKFFQPLVLLCYQVAMEVWTSLPDIENDDQEVVTSQLVMILTALENLLMKPISAQQRFFQEEKNPASAYEIGFPEGIKGDFESAQAIVNWISQLLNPSNWQSGDDGNPLFVSLDNPFPELPKMYIQQAGKMLAYGHQMAGTFVTLRPLEDTEAAQVWNKLAANYDSDDESSVAWTYKNEVYKKILELSGLSDNSVHLDLCCGPGRVMELIADFGENITMHGVDFSEEMVNRSKDRGMLVQQHNLNQVDKNPLNNVTNSIDSATISFGEMWLKMEILGPEIYRVLKPGGRFVFNIYNTIPEHISHVTQSLQEVGFLVEIQSETIPVENQETDLVSNKEQIKKILILTATKPETT